MAKLGTRKPTKWSEEPRPKPRTPHARRRWPWMLLLLLAAVVWVLPMVVAHSPLLNWCVALGTRDLEGTVRIESASLGWFSPVVLSNVEVRDAQNEPVLVIPRVVGQRWLARVLCNVRRPGQFSLEQPKLAVVLRDGGSNLEDLLAKYLAKERSRSESEFSVQIVDGSVAMRDRARGRQWLFEKLQLALSMSTAAGPLQLDASATVASADQPGQVSVKLQREEGGLQLSSTIDALPAAALRPILARWLPVSELDGRVSVAVRGQWESSASGKTSLEARLMGDDLLLGARAWGEDRVLLKRLQASCDASVSEDQLTVKRLATDCDLGNAALCGTFRLDRDSKQGPADFLRKQTYQLSAELDLARLAQMLPHALRIQQQTRITSGLLQASLSSQPGAQGTAWEGRIETSQLKAVQNGREMAWEQPVLMTLAAHDTAQGPVVDDLKCQSSFLMLDASGTPEKLTAAARFDLDQLASQFGQLIDLGRARPAGQGWGQLNWKRRGENFDADGQFQVRDLRVTLPDQSAWNEPNLGLFLSAAGRAELSLAARLDNASLRVEAGNDRLEARLCPPSGLSDAGAWTFDTHLVGRLEGWAQRLKALLGVGNWRAAGDCDVTGRIGISPAGIRMDQVKAVISQLALSAPGLAIGEPRVELAVSGRWDRAARQFQFQQLSLSSSALGLTSTDFVVSVPASGYMGCSGAVRYQGDLARLQTWTANPTAPPLLHWAGALSGEGRFQQSAQLVDAQITATVDNLTITNPRGKRLSDPQVRLLVQGNYNTQTQLLQLQQLDLASAIVAASAKGHVAGDQRSGMHLAGTVRYDLEKLSDLTGPYTNNKIRFVGHGSSPTTLRGPLTPDGAEAQTAMNWTSADVYGFRVGPGQLTARLSGGTVRCDPLSLEVSEGKVNITPSIRLLPPPMELSIEPGLVAQQIHVDTAVCENALKFAAPVLAGMSTADGRFSVQLDSCRLPLADMGRGTMSGRLTIHSMQLGPGPMIQELALLLNRSQGASLARESVIQFELRDGRIYHQGLELVFPDLTIRTQGSVGLDHTLSIVAQMSIPPRWLGQTVLSPALKNQTIQLPIAGTLEKPVLDRQAMAQLSRQFLGNAARNLLEENAKKQLERLFPQ